MGVMGAATRGVLAGAVATLAMDLVWYRRYRSGGGERSFGDWEFSSDASDFDDAPAPAKVGKRIADTFGVDLEPSSISTVNNAVHWTTGIGWGKVAGIVSAAAPVPPIAVGVATGVAALAASYAALGAVGVYQPVTEYDSETLLQDLTAHLVFGAVLGVTLAMLRSRRRR